MAQMIERQLTHRGAARSVSGMAAVLAHEIKNPLSGIRGAAQLLEASASTEDRPLAQLICRETDRICKLVDRMEVFGDERPLKLEPVNIHTVLDHVRQIGENGFAKRHHVSSRIMILRCRSSPAIRDKLIQVFLNLVKNAAEAIGATRDDGEIRCRPHSARACGCRCRIRQTRVSLPLEVTVTDTGSGHSRRSQAAFVRALRHHQGRRDGLGLALVAKIIGDHGGTIECESQAAPDVFRVHAAHVQNSAAIYSKEIEPWDGAMFLIADDDAAIRTVSIRRSAAPAIRPRATSATPRRCGAGSSRARAMS